MAARRGNAEPYRIKMVEPLRMTTPGQRKAAIEQAGYNTFLLKSSDVYIDLLTDSGTGAMSDNQWAGVMLGDESYAGSRSFEDLQEAVRDVYGFEYTVPTHQGRGAENIVSSLLVKPGDLVPANMYFTTTVAHIERAGGEFVDVVVDDALDPEKDHPFKGNVDIRKLEDVFRNAGPGRVPYVSVAVTVNQAGGQPVSLENIREVRRLCDRYGIRVVIDATRCVENAYFIKTREPGQSHRSVADILKDVMSCVDICIVSAKKDCLVNIGGFIGLRDPDLYRLCTQTVVVFEGLHTYGGLAGRDLEALARGIRESVDDDYIAHRVSQVQYLGSQLIEAGVPVVKPIGGHAVYLDAARFLPHIPRRQYPAQMLAAALYLDSGVRSMERGIVSAGRDKDGNEKGADLELVRLTIPRRVYTDRHMDVVADSVMDLYAKREKIGGLRMVYEPPVLRFFTARFEPV
ncbi:MAG: tyrosine phenol-lyase [Bacillota bacterium]